MCIHATWIESYHELGLVSSLMHLLGKLTKQKTDIMNTVEELMNVVIVIVWGTTTGTYPISPPSW